MLSRFYFAEVDDQRAHLVRTNEVAPIIIKNCREEFQHVSEFKEPIVYGQIAENMPEHALIQVTIHCSHNPLIYTHSNGRKNA